MNIEDLARMGWTYSEKNERYTVLFDRKLLTCSKEETFIPDKNGILKTDHYDYSFNLNGQTVENVGARKLYKAIHARAYKKIVEHLAGINKEPEPSLARRVFNLERKFDKLTNIPDLLNR